MHFFKLCWRCHTHIDEAIYYGNKVRFIYNPFRCSCFIESTRASENAMSF